MQSRDVTWSSRPGCRVAALEAWRSSRARSISSRAKAILGVLNSATPDLLKGIAKEEDWKTLTVKVVAAVAGGSYTTGKMPMSKTVKDVAEYVKKAGLAQMGGAAIKESILVLKEIADGKVSKATVVQHFVKVVAAGARGAPNKNTIQDIRDANP